MLKVEADLTREDRAFRLAEKLLTFEHVAVNNWCSDDCDTNVEEIPPIIDELFAEVRILIDRIRESIRDERGADLSDAATNALQAARNEFYGTYWESARIEKVRWLQQNEVESGWHVGEWLLKDSPFRSPAWKTMIRSVRRLIRPLPLSARSCYRLSYLLFRELVDNRNARFAERRGLCLADHFARGLAPALARMCKRVEDKIPALTGVCHDISIEAYHVVLQSPQRNDIGFLDDYVRWARERLRRSYHEIGRRLHEHSHDRIADIGPKPVWDSETRRLWYDGEILKKFDRKAVNQTRILVEFQEFGWPTWIDDPLHERMDETNCPDKSDEPRDVAHKQRDRKKRQRERLEDTVRDIGRGLANACNNKKSPISFNVVNDGTGVSWSRCGSV